MASPNFKLPFHSVFIAVGVGIPLWVIALGGFSSLTGKCNDQSGVKSADCGHDYALEWFSIWLEFVVLALLAAVAFVKCLAKLNLAVMALLTTATVLFINHANYYVRSAYFNEAILKRADSFDAVRAAAAGAVLLSLYNFGLIFYMSWLDVGSTAASATPTNEGNRVNVVVDPILGMKTVVAGIVQQQQQQQQEEPVAAETAA